MNREMKQEIEQMVRRALAEDIGTGDVTAGLIPSDTLADASVVARAAGMLCGQAWFNEVFRQVDEKINIRWHAQDGDEFQSGHRLCELKGPARGVLTGERVALNFLQLLSGTATRAKQYVEAVRGTGVVILDTRKTLPGLRRAQKYAVTCGGASNHRLGLYDAILIKENHITAAGSVTAAWNAARRSAPKGVNIEIEVENLDQLREALESGADRLLLDNFDLADLKTAVAEVRGRAQLEASGGIDLTNIRTVAETGVNYISLGDITKNVTAVDLSLRINRQT